jgi:WD40 repeat protein
MMHPHYTLQHRQPELTPEESLIFQQSIGPVLPLLNWLLAPNPENRPADARKVVQWIDGYLRKSQPVKHAGLKRWVGRVAVLALFLTVAFLAQSYSKLSSISGFVTKAHDSQIKTSPENTDSGEEVASIDLTGLTPRHSIALEPMTKLSISDNGEYGLFLSPKRAVELRSMADFSIISEWNLNDYPTEMVITNSGNYAAFSSPDGEIEIWRCGAKYSEGELANMTQISTDTLKDLSWSDEEKPRLAAIHGNNLSIINPHKAPASEEFLVTDRLPYEPHLILWRPGHKEIVCTITDGGLFVWDPEDRKPVSGLRAHGIGPIRLVSDSQGHFFYSTAPDGYIVKYDAAEIMIHADLGLVPSWTIVSRVATQSMVRNLTYLGDDQLAVLMVQMNEGKLINQLCLFKAGTDSKMVPFRQLKFEISEVIPSNSQEFFFLRSTDNKLYVFEMSEIQKHLESGSS